MMVLIFDGRKEGLVETAKCITQTLFAILIFDQQNNGPGIWWKKGGVSWNSQLHNTDFVCNITAVPINNDIAMFICDEIPKKKHLQMCSQFLCLANPLCMPAEKSFDEEICQQIIPGLDPSGECTSLTSIYLFSSCHIQYRQGGLVPNLSNQRGPTMILSLNSTPRLLQSQKNSFGHPRLMVLQVQGRKHKCRWR